MAGARIGSPSLNLCGSVVASTRKPTAKFFCNACTELSVGCKRGSFLTGKKLESVSISPSKRSTRRLKAARASGEEEKENGCVHLGRRAVLGALVTAVALSRFEKPGSALPEAKGNKSKSGNAEKAKASTSDIGEKWKLSRVYDATVLGEPVAVGGERNRVWQKLLQARVVYLGESERVPDADDRVLLPIQNPNLVHFSHR